MIRSWEVGYPAVGAEISSPKLGHQFLHCLVRVAKPSRESACQTMLRRGPVDQLVENSGVVLRLLGGHRFRPGKVPMLRHTDIVIESAVVCAIAAVPNVCARHRDELFSFVDTNERIAPLAVRSSLSPDRH